MFSITMQQEFLPTNLLIDTSKFMTPAFCLLIVVLGLFLVLLFAALGTKTTRVLVTGMIAALMGFIILSLVGIAASTSQTKELPETNKANFIKNIESVYDVDWVRVETVSPSAESIEVILSQDDVVYSAIVFQDPETFEPSVTLITGAEKAQELRKN